jgi:hypothetical protein
MTNGQIDDIFSYHKPGGNQAERYEHLRNHAKLGYSDFSVPGGRY